MAYRGMQTTERLISRVALHFSGGQRDILVGEGHYLQYEKLARTTNQGHLDGVSQHLSPGRDITDDV